MEVLETIQEIKSYLKGYSSIGFVPTMGALHEGHISLVRRATTENDTVACSIFVNPTQFSDSTDLENYPRAFDADIKLLEKTGCDLVFVPSDKEMYSNGTSTEQSFDFGHLDKTMEGLHRANHFQGVSDIVGKLFDVIRPHRAYFGEKDYQQLLIIKRLVEIEKRNIAIIPCPIVREQNGLAMSSRNKRLSSEGHNHASLIFETLSNVKGMVPTTSIPDVHAWVNDQFAHATIELEYFEIANGSTLHPVNNWSDSQHIRGFIAAHLEGIRLIDNLSLIP